MMQLWLEHFGVAVAAVSGVQAARGKGVDLFGVVVLALVTAFGGGTIRDLCLGANPVFWVKHTDYVLTALVAAVAMFVFPKPLSFPKRFLEYSDAIALSLFTIVGAAKCLTLEASPLIAVILGTATGVAGGIVRDVLLNELPMVFRPDVRLYATAGIIGATAFVLLKRFFPDAAWVPVVGILVTLVIRLAAIRWELKLPVYEPGQTDSTRSK